VRGTVDGRINQYTDELITTEAASAIQIQNNCDDGVELLSALLEITIG
jgi:hypothetical protein